MAIDMKCYQGHKMLFAGRIVSKSEKGKEVLIYHCPGPECFAVKEVVTVSGKIRKVNDLMELPPGLDLRLYW